MTVKYNRRKLLQAMGIGTLSFVGMDPITFIMENILAGIANKAYADEVNADDIMNYFYFYQPGGASSWYWDLPLIPNGTDQFNGNNPFLGNSLKNKYPDFDLEYLITKVGSEFYLPHIWNSDIPTVGGSTKMSAIANNMLMMRGVSTGIDGHVINPQIQQQPLAGKASYAGLNADRAIQPFPAIGLGGGSGRFQSNTGVSLAVVPRGQLSNSLNYLLAPFKTYPGGGMGGDPTSNTEDLIADVMTRIKEQAGKGDAVAEILYKDRGNAIKLLKKAFGDLGAINSTLNTKYKNLANSAIRDFKLPGLEDSPIYWDASSRADHVYKFALEDGYRTGEGVDVNEPYTVDKNADNIEMERTFAAAEYLLTEELTNTIVGDFRAINIEYSKVEKVSDDSITNNKTFRMGLDLHGTASLPQTIFFHNYYQSLSACLYEFRAALQSKVVGSGNMFDKTVVHITGDFNRQPRADARGSDHGWEGSNVTLFSGMIDKLTVLGDIKVESGQGNWPGTWGVGAPITEFGGQVASLKNVASTICTLLRVPSLSPNDLSFVRLVNGKAVPNIHKPKNV